MIHIKKPILIVGYERSGTTMLRRLISMHPLLEFDIVHENSKDLFRSETMMHAIELLTYPSTQHGIMTGGTSSIKSGQKIPYTTFAGAKRSIDKFINLFPGSWIIHIIRDPVGAINSQVKTFNRDPSRCVNCYFSSVPDVSKYLNLNYSEQTKTIKFEDIVTDPICFITSLYRWIGGDVDQQHVIKVSTTKEPWDHNGRMMCGLRYFDRIEDRPAKIVLDKATIQKIRSRS